MYTGSTTIHRAGGTAHVTSHKVKLFHVLWSGIKPYILDHVYLLNTGIVRVMNRSDISMTLSSVCIFTLLNTGIVKVMNRSGISMTLSSVCIFTLLNTGIVQTQCSVCGGDEWFWHLH